MPRTQSIPPSHLQPLMHETPNHTLKTKLQAPMIDLHRGQSDNFRSLRPEAARSNIVRGASADLSEFIWPVDHRPEVPHNDFERAQELPTVDLSALQSGDEKGRERAAKLLVKSFSEWGFVQVNNHGVPSEVIETMQDESRKFFDLPLEQKEKGKSTSSTKHEGFGYGVESGFYYAGKPWVDRFQCRWSPVCGIRETVEEVFNAGDADKFRSTMEDYNSRLDNLTVKILELCAQGLSLDRDTFTSPFNGTAGDCIARMNYYPPCPLPSLTLGLGAHTDPNLLTILNQCKVGGLQVCKNGTWITVKPKPDTFIINVGDSFEAWTNGRFRSVEHRAVVNETEARISLAYFASAPIKSVMTVPSELIAPKHPLQFRPEFTWEDYKTHLLGRHTEDNSVRTSRAWLRKSG